MLSACGKCIHCVTDKEEPYLWVCALGHLALSEKIFGCDDLERERNIKMDITKSTNKGLWYFAHPYTCKDTNGNFVPAGEEANFNLCNSRAAQLFQLGYNVYAPISHTHPIHRASPDFLARHEHELWYQLDNEFIDGTDWSGIILAPGWEKSSGCRAEKERIEARGLQVLFYTDIYLGEK